MVEIGKEKSKEDIIAKAESKELTKRIATRFINLKQTMVDKNKFISLGENLSDSLVNTILMEEEQRLLQGKEFITKNGIEFLNSLEPIKIQQNQTMPAPLPIRGNSNALSTATRTIIRGGNRFRPNGNPQAVETPPDSEFKTIKKSKSCNNILEILKQENMQKLAENMQITKTPTKNKGHEI